MAFSRVIKVYYILQSVVNSYKGLCLQEKWLDTQEVCLMLGISKRALQGYKDRKILPYSSIQRKNYFKRSDVEQLLASQNSQNTKVTENEITHAS
ncbi:helix-turn-helix domain-containing protein [Capnocytophaga canimorsus]|uniref:helix-turn-helix domain-containing protein n=1 Tax=Capnocytophaga canimorsus TaxID=28188 RepID=UPI0036F364F0